MNLFSRRERELDEEIEAHLAMAIRDRIERGEDPREAELAARREFGNRILVQETTRDMWRWVSLDQFFQDAGYAVRGVRRSPGFTVVAVASLALGIGANTAIFSLMYTVMLRTLAVAHPEQLVELLQKYPGEPRGNGYWSWRSYEHYRDQNQVFSAMTGTSIDSRARIQTEGSEPTTGIAEYVLSNYFPELGIQPARGRLIGPEDTSAGASVAVVSWSLWSNRFNQDPGIVGKKMLVGDALVEIAGVAPREFVGLILNAKTDVWLPAKREMGLTLIARLKPGVPIQQARTEMTQLYRFTIEERAASSKDPQVRRMSVEVEPAGAGLSSVRDRIGKPIVVLMGVVGVLLLLACVNVAGMLLARGAGRAREMALRLGLGASRGRLARQVLTESLMLSLAGTLAGAAVAYAGTSVLVRMIASGRPHDRVQLEVRPDANVLFFAAGIAILTGLIFGLAPALSAFRSDPALALRQAGHSVETPFGRLVGKTLLIAQVALSVLLLSSAGLFIDHLSNLRTTDLGFRRDHVLLVTLDPTRSGYSGERLSLAYQHLLDRFRATPGVRSVSLSAPTPLNGAGASGFGTVNGFDERAEDRRWISISWVAPRYFETLATPLLAGRDFRFEDQGVAIINKTLAGHYFANRNPIGQRITLDHVTGTREPATYEIVGVVGDANYYEIREPEKRSIYLPAFGNGRVIAHTFVIRTDVNPNSIVSEVRRAVRDTAEAVVVANVTTLTDQIDATIVSERMMATLSGFFAVVGALLAGVGVYGLLAYTVTRRTNEIGIRMALGATPSRVLRMVLFEGLAIVSAGLALGVPLAIWGRTLAAAVILGLTTRTAPTFAWGAVTIVAVALLAASVPARRAARVDPMLSLRHE